MTAPTNASTIDELDLRDAAYLSVSDTMIDTEMAEALALPVAGFAKKIATIERFIDQALSSSEAPFVFVRHGDGSMDTIVSPLAKRYFSQLPEFIRQTRALSSRYVYNERLTILIEIFAGLGLDPMIVGWGIANAAHRVFIPAFGQRSAAHIFNTVVADLRRRCKAKPVQEKMRSRQRAATKLHGSCGQYCNQLIDKYKRLLVLRLEFYYQSDIAHNIHIEVAQHDIERFLTNRRSNALFKDLVGYIVKTEYGVSKGIHHHVLLMFDGYKKNPLYQTHYGQQFCKYWENKIAPERGEAWNLNNARNLKKFGMLSTLGIGDIRASDALLRHNLTERVLGYLCKNDQYFRPAAGSDFRRLRKGQYRPVQVKHRPKPASAGAPGASCRGEA